MCWIVTDRAPATGAGTFVVTCAKAVVAGTANRSDTAIRLDVTRFMISCLHMPLNIGDERNLSELLAACQSSPHKEREELENGVFAGLGAAQ